MSLGLTLGSVTLLQSSSQISMIKLKDVDLMFYKQYVLYKIKWKKEIPFKLNISFVCPYCVFIYANLCNHN